jgi:hypothetical protein
MCLKSIAKYLSAQTEKENYDFLHALFEFNKDLDTALSPKENIKKIMEACDKNMRFEVSTLNAFGTAEMQSEYLNEVTNVKKQMQLLLAPQYENLLNMLINDVRYRQEVQGELEQQLFERPKFF